MGNFPKQNSDRFPAGIRLVVGILLALGLVVGLGGQTLNFLAYDVGLALGLAEDSRHSTDMVERTMAAIGWGEAGADVLVQGPLVILALVGILHRRHFGFVAGVTLFAIWIYATLMTTLHRIGLYLFGAVPDLSRATYVGTAMAILFGGPALVSLWCLAVNRHFFDTDGTYQDRAKPILRHRIVYPPWLKIWLGLFAVVVCIGCFPYIVMYFEVDGKPIWELPIWQEPFYRGIIALPEGGYSQETWVVIRALPLLCFLIGWAYFVFYALLVVDSAWALPLGMQVLPVFLFMAYLFDFGSDAEWDYGGFTVAFFVQEILVTVAVLVPLLYLTKQFKGCLEYSKNK